MTHNRSGTSITDLQLHIALANPTVLQVHFLVVIEGLSSPCLFSRGWDWETFDYSCEWNPMAPGILIQWLGMMEILDILKVNWED